MQRSTQRLGLAGGSGCCGWWTSCCSTFVNKKVTKNIFFVTISEVTPEQSSLCFLFCSTPAVLYFIAAAVAAVCTGKEGGRGEGSSRYRRGYLYLFSPVNKDSFLLPRGGGEGGERQRKRALDARTIAKNVGGTTLVLSKR